MVLENFGIHKLESFPKKGLFGSVHYYLNSFFIKRNYLNYTLFSPFEFNHLKDFIYNKGGIGKQLHTSTLQFNKSTESFFNIFGSSAVILDPHYFPPDKEDQTLEAQAVRIENWGEDFFDDDIIIDLKSQIQKNWFTLSHRGKKFLVTDESIIFTEEGWVPNRDYQNFDVAPDNPEIMFKALSKLSLDYHIPRCHKGTYRMQNLTPSKLEKNINFYSKRI